MTDLSPTSFSLAAAPANSVRYYALMATTLAGLLLVIVLDPATVGGQLNPLFEEGGFVEGLSPMGYLFCIALIVAQGGFRFAVARAFPLIVILLAMALRELDFHTRFTVMSLEKLKFYISPEVPPGQKALGLLVLLLLAAVVLHVLRRHGRNFLAGLSKGDPVSVATALSIGSILLSKSLDGLNNRLDDLGYAIGGNTTHVLEKIEETTELGISLFAIIAIVAYFGSAREGGGRRP